MTFHITLRDVVERLCCNAYESTVNLIIKLQSITEHEIRTRIIRSFVNFYKKKLFQLHALVSWLGLTTIPLFFEAYNNFLLYVDTGNNFFFRSLDELYLCHSTLFSMRKRMLSIENSASCLMNGKIDCLPHTIQSFGRIYTTLESRLKDRVSRWSTISLAKSLLVQHRFDVRQYSFEVNHGVLIAFAPDGFVAHFVGRCNSLRPWKICSVQFSRNSALMGNQIRDMNLEERKVYKEIEEFSGTSSLSRILKKCFQASFRCKLENLVSLATARIRRESLGDWIHCEPTPSTTFCIWKRNYDSKYQFCYEFIQDANLDKDNLTVHLKPHCSSVEFSENFGEICVSSNVWLESICGCLPKQLFENFTAVLIAKKLYHLRNRLELSLLEAYTFVQECNSLEIYCSNICALRLFICKFTGSVFVQAYKECEKCDKFRSAIMKFQDELNNIQSDDQFLKFVISCDNVSIVKPVDTWFDLQQLMIGLISRQSIEKALPSSWNSVGERVSYSICYWVACDNFNEEIQTIHNSNNQIIRLQALQQLESISAVLNDEYKNFQVTEVPTSPIQVRFRKQFMHVSEAMKVNKYHRSLSSVWSLKRLSILCWGTLTTENNIIFHYGGELVHINWDYLCIYIQLFTYSQCGQKSVSMSNILKRYAAAYGIDGLNKYCQLSVGYNAIPNADLIKITFQKFNHMQNSKMKTFEPLLQEVYHDLSENINIHSCYFVNEVAAVVSLYRCIVNLFILVTSVKISFGNESGCCYMVQPDSCGKSVANNVCIHCSVDFCQNTRLSPCSFFYCEIYCDLEQADYGISFRNCAYEEIHRVAPHEVNLETGEKLLKYIISQVTYLDN